MATAASYSTGFSSAVAHSFGSAFIGAAKQRPSLGRGWRRLAEFAQGARRGDAQPDQTPDRGVRLGVDDDIQAIAADLSRRRLPAPQILDNCRSGQRLVAKRLR